MAGSNPIPKYLAVPPGISGPSRPACSFQQILYEWKHSVEECAAIVKEAFDYCATPHKTAVSVQMMHIKMLQERLAAAQTKRDVCKERHDFYAARLSAM